LANDPTVHQPTPAVKSAENPSPGNRSRRHRSKTPPARNLHTAPSSGEDSPAARKNQRDAILQILLAARGQWVPLSQLSACAYWWGPRLFELRASGFEIESADVDGPGTRFRLVPGVALNVAATDAPAFPEFGSLTPERYPD
jgi:hypothetical protein